MRVWDIRARREVANVAAHTSDRGSGAVGAIQPSACREGAGSGLIVTAGADRSLAVLDARAGFTVAHRFTEHR